MSKNSVIEGYIDRFDGEVKNRLNIIYDLLKKVIPGFKEKISYGVPTATINDKYFIYFAGYKNHISIYPVTPAMEKIKEAMDYRTGKGTLQFPLEKELPLKLIKEIIKARLGEIK